MKHLGRFLAAALAATAFSGVAFAPAGHAVYQKVETYEDRYAMIDSTDCTNLSSVCTEVLIFFGFDESSPVQSYAQVEQYSVDLTGPNPVFTLVAQGSWYDASLQIFIASNRKSATFSGLVDLATEPCDQVARTCSGPVVTPFVQASATASSSRAGSFKKKVNTLGPCTVTRTGTYALRRSKTGAVSLDSVSYSAVPVTGSVIIEKDNIKVTSKNCLGVAPIVTAMGTARHHSNQLGAIRHWRIR